MAYAAWLEPEIKNSEKPTTFINIPLASDYVDFAYLATTGSCIQTHLRWSISILRDGGKPNRSWFSHKSLLISLNQQSNLNIGKALGTAISTNNPKLLVSSSYWKFSAFKKFDVRRKWRNWARFDDLLYPIAFESSIDVDWRLYTSSNLGRVGSFLELLCTLLPLYLPVVFLEGFLLCRKSVLDLSLYRPKAMFSANALNGNLVFKVLAAEWQKEGTKLLYSQHGGGYGIDKYHIVEEYETRVSDCFYTWGWTRADRVVRPLAPPLPRYSMNKTVNVLLMCCDYPKSIYRIHFQPMGDNVSKLHQETYEFLRYLKDHNKLLIRGYPVEYGWGAHRTIRITAPDSKFETTQPSPFVRYSQSQLVVHNYLGTSYLETLALNIPTVCFYDPNMYSFRSEAQPFINALINASILHYTGREAALFATSIQDDPYCWWSKSDVQYARSNFIHRFANFSENCSQHWEEEFQSQINE